MNFYNKYLFEFIIKKIKDLFCFFGNTLIPQTIDILAPQSIFLLILIIGYSLLYIFKKKYLIFLYKEPMIIKSQEDGDKHIELCKIYNDEIELNPEKTIIQIDEIKKTILCICYVKSIMNIKKYAETKGKNILTTIAGYDNNKRLYRTLYRTQNIASLLEVKVSNNIYNFEKFYDENYLIEIIFEESNKIIEEHQITTIKTDNISTLVTKSNKYDKTTYKKNISINKEIKNKIDTIKASTLNVFIILNILIYLIAVLFIRIPINQNHLCSFTIMNIIAFIVMIYKTLNSIYIKGRHLYLNTLENKEYLDYFSQNTQNLIHISEKNIYHTRIFIPISNKKHKKYFLIKI